MKDEEKSAHRQRIRKHRQETKKLLRHLETEAEIVRKKYEDLAKDLEDCDESIKKMKSLIAKLF